ncbi:MAG TPA: inosine monophosphate cyclohydrolase [Clostridiales bacterium]|nr:inosine monophosphate cyclohydrolase [Clostridiales bacterium]
MTKPFEKRSLIALLAGNPYPGRGIAIGCTPDGQKAVLIYFIMGRSANSRNRVFEQRGEALFTRPFDESKVEDPSLIIYAPLRVLSREDRYSLILTNGDQTDTIFDALKRGASFEQALETRCFEPDAPNFTPRISGLAEWTPRGEKSYRLSILKSADPKGTGCLRQTFRYPMLAGTGHFISTYVTDGSPLPSFEGEPVRIEIPKDVKGFAQVLWDNLEPDNKISLYLRSVDFVTKETQNVMINRHGR